MRLALLASLSWLLLLVAGPGSLRSEPLRIDDALPERLSLTLQHRIRYERLSDPFRVLTPSRQDVLVLRTLLHGRLDLTEQLRVGAELMDSRAYREDFPVGTGIVNAVELLQAYLELTLDGPFGGRSQLTGGRLTLDVGSRRFVARNRYRNTINGFTGIDWRWQNESGRELRAFWALPVQRLPFRPADTSDNEIELDEESLDVQLGGLVFGDTLFGATRGEAFVFGLFEDDSRGRPTRNRRLATPGLRISRAPEAGRFDYVLESALQLGESRASAAARRDLDHFAHFHHLEVGYRFDHPWKPRLVLQFDYASGDDDPDDGRNGRFDTLFGARRFDYGPTGIYGPFVRANLVTPGVRLQLAPGSRLSGFTAVRGFWLAENRDAWVGTGLRDRSGDSGSYLGTQIELRVRIDPLPGNLRIEAGVAHLFAGGFRDAAPLSNGRGDATYFYTQAAVRF